MATSAIFDPRPTPYFDQNGELAVGAKAYFYEANTSTPLAVYTDQDLVTPHEWPVVAGSSGTFAPIYLPFTDYRFVVKDKYGVTLFDVPIVPNEAPASAGGGTTVSATEKYQTGDIVFRWQSGPRLGFVRANGRTIGSASSGATEYAGDTASDLFTFLYEGLADSVATVSGGRGASAAADWAANKTIVVPSMRGRAPVGLDDMGGDPAQNIQIKTTGVVTNGSASVTVADATGLARGMNCVIDGNSAGTISAISGLTVTLSGAYGGSTNAAAEFRASFFSDAQTPGAAGGAQTISQTTAELAAHDHAVTDTHTHGFKTVNAGAAGGSGWQYPWFTGAAGGQSPATNTEAVQISSAGSILINSKGSGLPTQIIQPGRLGTWYVKL